MGTTMACARLDRRKQWRFAPSWPGSVGRWPLFTAVSLRTVRLPIEMMEKKKKARYEDLTTILVPYSPIPMTVVVPYSYDRVILLIFELSLLSLIHELEQSLNNCIT